MTGTAPAIAPPTAADLPAALLDAAQAYAVLGWRIFPCQPGAKTPLYRRAHADDDEQRACPGGHACGHMGHGFKDATSDPDRIARWWAAAPLANVGVATGGAGGRYSPDVLDVDVKDGAPGRASLERIRQQLLIVNAWAASVTPSGGWHYWFDGTVQQSATLKKAGIDFRSMGGYVLAPPSVVRVRVTPGRPWESRPYTWSWIDLRKEGHLIWSEVRDFLAPPPPPRDLNRVSFADNATPIIEWFTKEGTGNRNNALFWAACRILESGYGTERLDDLAVEARRSGLADHEVRKTIESATRKILRGDV